MSEGQNNFVCVVPSCRWV